MTIFDKQILPLLTYGCVVWGTPTSTNQILLENVPESPHYKETVYQYLDKN